MLNTPRSLRGMVTSPHHLASQAGLDVLRDGGNAVEAVVATAAALAIAYPHMTGIGGDGFWLIAEPGRDPVAVDGCGAAGTGAALDLYRARGHAEIPWRGPLAANTVAGTISGWEAALSVARGWGEALPLARVLRDAIEMAEGGVPVTASQEELTRRKLPELAGVPGFAQAFLADGAPPREGTVLKQPALGATLRRLAAEGLDGFYRGRLGDAIAADLARAGAPVTRADLDRHQAALLVPLRARLACGDAFNFPPPTQGVASLMILALFERLGVGEAEGFEHVHGLVEATKQAFLVRDREVGDPAHMAVDARDLLAPAALDRMVARIDRRRALPWPAPPSAGDTVWLGAIDGAGRAVSMIQSVYFEFGSGLVLPETGITWQNRGCSFRLAEDGWNALRPGRKPFHTLNPALARLSDGRTMVYGTMGGEGQPQTQAAVFTRYALFGQGLQAAVTAPRWLLGRTWGEQSVTLKLESRFDPALVAALREAGHAVEVLEPFTSVMGHAGAIVRQPSGVLEGATDPRSDGAVAGF
ncbi:gamma-glutamyltransferase family protein [Arenibaculum pallidiluteum]|uniref:gamma-glutamyltransferase family protein n=1 Tax=Arenibaculum pallidiluteum TaxID=2812559 RepID=UPI001A95AE97|nr:gamma-glutamyltransferase family protein [Arenibaculum pallidiluteum]